MAEKTNVPEIRFAGFTDPWEQRKLSDIGEVITGSTPSTQHPEYYSEDGIPWVTPTDIVDNIIHDTPRKLSPLGEKVGRVVPANTILVTCIASIGKNTMLANIGSFNQQINGLVPDKKKYDSYFLLTESFHWSSKMKREAAAGTMQIVNKNEFSAIDTYVPEWAEQKAIGDYFRNIDNLIALHQRECDKLAQLKKSMLDQMFPKPGERFPEIRFAGFTDPWEQRKVKEITDRYDNLRIPVAASLRVAGTTPYYGANGIQDYVEGYTHDGEFILVAEDGAIDLKNYPVKCVKGRIWVNNHAHVLQGKCACADNQFLAYAISQADIESLLVGGGRAKLNAETLMDIELLLPSKDEQIQIGHYLARLDRLITLHQRKLELLRNTKKSLLDRMFV